MSSPDPFLLPGQFAIQTFLSETFLTAVAGGGRIANAVHVNGTVVGPTEKFRLWASSTRQHTPENPEGFLQYAIQTDHDPADRPGGDVLFQARSRLHGKPRDRGQFGVVKFGRRPSWPDFGSREQLIDVQVSPGRRLASQVPVGQRQLRRHALRHPGSLAGPGAS